MDDTPASRTWTIDLTAPQTTIDSGPLALTNSTSAELHLLAGETGSSFECSLDSAAFAACTSPANYSGLAASPHTFRVRATDAAGNVDDTPANRTWTIDLTAPQTTIDSGPAATTTSTAASFRFSASETGSSFECSLDNSTFAACTSPRQYSGLGQGSHEFRVRATDPAGNADPTAAVWTWTISSPGTCTAATTTVAAAADTWILQSSPASNYGNDSVLKVDTKTGANARMLVRFTLPPIPSGCGVTDAKLRLFSASYKDGRTLEAHRLAGSWTESGVTWTSQPATTGAAATVASGVGYREWSVAAHVQGDVLGR